MSSFQENYKRYFMLSAAVVFIYAVCAALTSHSLFFLSLATGSLLGLFNLWSMYRDTQAAADFERSNKLAFALGMPARVGAGVVIALLFLQFPEHFGIVPLAAGLMTPYLIILFSLLFFAFSSD
ncbi:MULTISPECIES: ATP synthase subunit I [Sinobaca]|uniref:ATP synthase protein I n=1 Tax=Sinobaca qinghaiensis TaxID=342944 RepID=A0A419V7P2_9BACL|nr:MULTISPECIES: ATP synthase subunit I [Sinobaca]RKD76085.1 ATP synthase protein I [Sinobaca qinghaiensis]